MKKLSAKQYNKRLATIGVAISLKALQNVLGHYKNDGKTKLSGDDLFITHHLACLIFWVGVAEGKVI